MKTPKIDRLLKFVLVKNNIPVDSSDDIGMLYGYAWTKWIENGDLINKVSIICTETNEPVIVFNPEKFWKAG